MRETDPLERLREAWGSLEPRELPLEESDERTLAALAWMRAAWEAIEPPPARVPWRFRARRWRRALAPLAAAALLAALASLAVMATRGRRSGDATDATGTPPRELAEGRTRAEVGVRGLDVVSLEPDRLELRSGPVRLILITNPMTEELR